MTPKRSLSVCIAGAILVSAMSLAASSPAHFPAADAAGTSEGGSGMLVVLNKAEASASILDLATGKELTKIKTGEGPHEVDVSPDGRTAVVCDYGAQTPGNTLTVIDLVKREAVKTIDLGQYHRPHGIQYMPDGRHVVVTAEHEANLLVVDVEAGKVTKVIPTGARVSHMVVLSPDATRAYVANIMSDSMCAFDLVKGELLATIPTGPEAEGIDVSPDGSEVWVSNRRGNTISIIDAKTLKVVETLDSPAFPIRVKFTPDGKRVLVSNARSGDVAVFDAESRTEIARIKMDEEIVDDTGNRLFSDQFDGSPVPIGILIPESGTHAYIANTMADIVSVIDLATLKVVNRLKAGDEPDGLGFSTLSPTSE